MKLFFLIVPFLLVTFVSTMDESRRQHKDDFVVLTVNNSHANLLQQINEISTNIQTINKMLALIATKIEESSLDGPDTDIYYRPLLQKDSCFTTCLNSRNPAIKKIKKWLGLKKQYKAE